MCRRSWCLSPCGCRCDCSRFQRSWKRRSNGNWRSSVLAAAHAYKINDHVPSCCRARCPTVNLGWMASDSRSHTKVSCDQSQLESYKEKNACKCGCSFPRITHANPAPPYVSSLVAERVFHQDFGTPKVASFWPHGNIAFIWDRVCLIFIHLTISTRESKCLRNVQEIRNSHGTA